MADEDKQSEQSVQQEPPSGDVGKKAPDMVPYERFQEVNSQLRELQAWREKQEADAKQAQDAQLAEQQKWQELATKREAELNSLRAEQLRTKIAMQKGIPAELIDRLSGDTEEEITADADKLLNFLKPATGPGVPPASKGGQPKTLDISSMTPEEIRQNKDALIRQAFQ